MHYTELYSREDLIKLRDGLDILERVVDSDKLGDLDLWIYGICRDPNILDIAKETIISSEKEYMADDGGSSLREEDVELLEIAVAVPLSSADSIDILFGSGHPLTGLDFAYNDAGESGEGIRTVQFYSNFQSDRIRFSELSEHNLADTSMYLDEYYKDKGAGTPIQFNKKVERNEEAITPEPIPQSLTPPVPKQTSLRVSSLKQIVENFLG